MKYPHLYKDWHDYDLLYQFPQIERIQLWKKLRVEDEERAWLFIEEHYLDKYSKFVKIDLDYSSTGIWENPFPSNRADININPTSLGLPEEVCKDLEEWQDYFDLHSRPWDADESCDYEKLDKWGLIIAKKVKLFTQPNVYVEYHPFRELAIIRNEVVELDVPEFLKILTNF